MIRVTRKYRFSSSHRLHTPALTDEENRRTYGKCNNPFGHGHNYTLAVSVAGRPNIRVLDDLVQEQVIQAFDHRNLNTQVPEFAGGTLVPTSECLAVVIRQRLEKAWPQGFPALDRVYLEETKNNKFELAASR